MSPELQMLERAFNAELFGVLPFRCKAAMLKRLAAKRLVERLADGWKLTPKGHHVYRSWAVRSVPL